MFTITNKMCSKVDMNTTSNLNKFRGKMMTEKGITLSFPTWPSWFKCSCAFLLPNRIHLSDEGGSYNLWKCELFPRNLFLADLTIFL